MILTNHILEQCFSSSSLTPKDMTKMGLKVTGATGEAKLKVNNLLFNNNIITRRKGVESFLEACSCTQNKCKLAEPMRSLGNRIGTGKTGIRISFKQTFVMKKYL